MKTRWFQFRLRTLMLFTLAAALLLAGWCAFVEPYRAQQQAMDAIKKAGGSYETQLSGPAWLRKLFGRQAFFQDMVTVDLSRTEASDPCLQRVLRLPRLKELTVTGKTFNDDHLRRLAGMKSLEQALLVSTGVSRREVDDLERRRRDLAVTIGLSVEDLGREAWRGVNHPAQGLIATYDGNRPLGSVPAAIQQWAGKKVRLTGWLSGMPAVYFDSLTGEIKEVKQVQGDGPTAIRLRKVTSWLDVVAPPHETVAVHFKQRDVGHTVEIAGDYPFAVEGILEIPYAAEPDARAYVLRDASLVGRRLAEDGVATGNSDSIDPSGR